MQCNATSRGAGTPATVQPRDLARRGTEAELEAYLAAATDLTSQVEWFGRTLTLAQVLVNAVSQGPSRA